HPRPAQCGAGRNRVPERVYKVGSGGALHPSETSHQRDFCFLRLRVKALTPLEDRSARGTHASGAHSDQEPASAKRSSGQPKMASIFLPGVTTARGRTAAHHTFEGTPDPVAPSTLARRHHHSPSHMNA